MHALIECKLPLWHVVNAIALMNVACLLCFYMFISISVDVASVLLDGLQGKWLVLHEINQHSYIES